MSSVMLELSPATLDAIADRVVARLRTEGAAHAVMLEPLSCEVFANKIGRSVEFVQDLCRRRKVRTLDGKKPYRIPVEELQRYLERRAR